MQKIVPHLWFDTQAKEAAEFHVSSFGKSSKITGSTTLQGTPSGEVETVTFDLLGYLFMAISAGPMFTLNPSVSFFVQIETASEVDRLWSKLIEGGQVMMPLDKYPWSECYGWLQDRYGLTWQISLGKKEDTGGQAITPCLMYTGDTYGQAEDAIRQYTSIFRNSEVEGILRFGKDEAPDLEGNVKHAQVRLEGQTFMIMESAHDHEFGFNEAISLMVYCDTQEEIEYYWEKLKADGDPDAQQCGWLKDRYGVSWQVAPRLLGEMIRTGTRDQINRVTQTFLPMKKLDIAALQKAYQQE